MFSDVVLLHGVGGGNNSGGSGTDSQASNTSAVAVTTTTAGNNNQQQNLSGKNVCSSEKMTQTGNSYFRIIRCKVFKFKRSKQLLYHN